ncbi:MAG: hypothetical protein U0003_04815 [Vampirovibrionales bacterium]
MVWISQMSSASFGVMGWGAPARAACDPFPSPHFARSQGGVRSGTASRKTPAIERHKPKDPGGIYRTDWQRFVSYWKRYGEWIFTEKPAVPSTVNLAELFNGEIPEPLL